MSASVYILLDLEKQVQGDKRSLLTDLSGKVLDLAMSELVERFGQDWFQDYEPTATLEPPSLMFKLTVTNAAFATEIDSCFRRHWYDLTRQIDQA